MSSHHLFDGQDETYMWRISKQLLFLIWAIQHRATMFCVHEPWPHLLDEVDHITLCDTSGCHYYQLTGHSDTHSHSLGTVTVVTMSVQIL